MAGSDRGQVLANLEIVPLRVQYPTVNARIGGIYGCCLVLVVTFAVLGGCRDGRNYQSLETEAGTASSAPRVAIENPDFNFGPVTIGDALTHSFVIKNAGSKPLVITDIVESCCCTLARLVERQIAPGASTSLEVRYRPNGITGPDRQTLTLRTNDPESSEVTISVAANVSADLRF